MSRVRRAVWVDPSLLLMMTDKGVDLSGFLNKAMAAFLDLPDDPTVKLLRENLENSGIRVRIHYINQLRDRIQKYEQTHLIEDTEKAKQKELMSQLEKFGTILQKISCYPQILEALESGDPESSCWDTALFEINKTNGKQYELHELWNQALEWYYKCARVKP